MDLVYLAECGGIIAYYWLIIAKGERMMEWLGGWIQEQFKKAVEQDA